MRSIFLAATAAIALFAFSPDDAAAQSIGIGTGSVTAGSAAGSQSTVQGGTGGQSASAILGLTFGTVTNQQAAGGQSASGAQAACSGSNCATVTAAGQQNATAGQTTVSSGALGLGASQVAGVGAGQSTGAAGSIAGATFNFGALFVTP